MTDETEKLSRFQDAVLDQIESEIKVKLDKAKAESKKILEKADDDFLGDSYREISARTKEIQSYYEKSVSKRRFDNSREVLLHRMQLIDDFFEKLKVRLIEFSGSAAYADFLVKQLAAANSEKPFNDKTVVYGRQCDLELLGAVTVAYPGVRVEASRNIKLGGISIFYSDENRYAELTLENALDEEKRAFVGKTELQL